MYYNLTLLNYNLTVPTIHHGYCVSNAFVTQYIMQWKNNVLPTIFVNFLTWIKGSVIIDFSIEHSLTSFNRYFFVSFLSIWRSAALNFLLHCFESIGLLLKHITWWCRRWYFEYFKLSTNVCLKSDLCSRILVVVEQLYQAYTKYNVCKDDGDYVCDKRLSAFFMRMGTTKCVVLLSGTQYAGPVKWRVWFWRRTQYASG